MLIKGLSQGAAVQPHVRRKAAKDVYIAYVLSSFKEGAKERFIILTEPSLMFGPVYRLMGTSRAGLYRRKLDRDV